METFIGSAETQQGASLEYRELEKITEETALNTMKMPGGSTAYR
jgi:hypothetical protein